MQVQRHRKIEKCEGKYSLAREVMQIGDDFFET
jgi:hypothetical protein